MSTHDRPGAEEPIEETPDLDVGAAGNPQAAEEAAEPSPAAVDDGEADVDQLRQVTRERDEYLDALRRLQADFENYKKRMLKQQTEQLERAAGNLVDKLLVVLDTADLAVRHGAGEGTRQLRGSLLDVLSKEGLDRLDPQGEAFDPTVAEAVAHEPDGDGGGPVVAEVLRAGYRWKGRVLRPAMVKVRG